MIVASAADFREAARFLRRSHAAPERRGYCALGARGVILGRAWAYALAAQGQAGVRKMLQLIESEMRAAMSLTGVTRIGAINGSILARGGNA